MTLRCGRAGRSPDVYSGNGITGSPHVGQLIWSEVCSGGTVPVLPQ